MGLFATFSVVSVCDRKAIDIVSKGDELQEPTIFCCSTARSSFAPLPLIPLFATLSFVSACTPFRRDECDRSDLPYCIMTQCITQILRSLVTDVISAKAELDQSLEIERRKWLELNGFAYFILLQCTVEVLHATVVDIVVSQVEYVERLHRRASVFNRMQQTRVRTLFCSSASRRYCAPSN